MKKIKKHLKTFVAAGLGALLFVAPLHIVPAMLRTSVVEQAAVVLDQSVNVLAQTGQGSGVIFHSSYGGTYVLTAAHVVEGIPLRGGLEVSQGTNSWSALLVVVDAERDLALLRVNAAVPSCRPAELFHGPLPLGSPLLHVGNVFGFNGSFSVGHLSAKGRMIDGQEYWQSSVMAAPGSSGGGVFTTDGQLVGILLRGADMGINFFAPVETIQAFAVDHDLQWLLE